jgi:hypothetical protein
MSRAFNLFGSVHRDKIYMRIFIEVSAHIYIYIYIYIYVYTV